MSVCLCLYVSSDYDEVSEEENKNGGISGAGDVSNLDVEMEINVGVSCVNSGRTPCCIMCGVINTRQCEECEIVFRVWWLGGRLLLSQCIFV